MNSSKRPQADVQIISSDWCDQVQKQDERLFNKVDSWKKALIPPILGQIFFDRISGVVQRVIDVGRWLGEAQAIYGIGQLRVDLFQVINDHLAQDTALGFYAELSRVSSL